jgi:hypothetical protein
MILNRKAFSLGVLAVQGLHRGLEDVFLKLLILQGELFQCSGTEQQEFYWDKVRERFAQAKFSGAPWREAVNTALLEESTTATVPVSRASTAQLELCGCWSKFFTGQLTCQLYVQQGLGDAQGIAY